MLTDGDGVTGVALASGEQVAAAAVVLNPDLPVAYERLLPGVTPPARLSRMRPSPSAWVLLAGVRGPFAGVAHHNIHFGADYRGAFDDLIGTGRAMRDPSLLVSLPTETDPALAPPGHTSMFALVPVPALPSAVDWSAGGARRFRDRHVAHLESVGYDGLAARIVVERMTAPPDWAAQGLFRGTPFSLSHRFWQTGWFRPRNTRPDVPGLVFVGSGTVPGVGVPMVLVSGRLAAERVVAG